MSIKLNHDNGRLDAIELGYLNHHYALPHLKHFLKSKGAWQCKTIKKINLNHSNLNHSDYEALHDILQLMSKIREISFVTNHIDTLDTGYIFDSLSGNELNTFKFVDNWIGDKISSDYFSFLSNKKLVVLDFSLNWLRNTGIQLLLDALNGSTVLNELVLSCNDFDLEGMKAVRRFVLNHPSIKVLDISYNNLDEESAEEISAMLIESHSLTHLNVRSNKIQNAGAESITQALGQNTHLNYIDLSDNEITQSSVNGLLRMAESHDTLKYLILKHNHLNPSSLTSGRSDLQVAF